MEMFRNKEFRNFAILYAVITACTIILGFSISTAAGILAFASSAVSGAAFLAFTRARYRSLAQISEQIDLVLHNGDRLYISESAEGELSILQNEITKMTLRIREQNEALRKEKKHLADSLADIAHQLRTPLTSVTLILSLLEKNPDEDERKDLLHETEELLMRMDWLITSLLKLSRLDAGVVVFQVERIQVDHLIDAALRPLLIPLELHDITIQLDVPAGLTITGDSVWLSEAIQNILKNGMESAGDHGKIELACEDNLLFTEITIHDSGSGFTEEVLPRLFDRFYRDKNSETAGYGIGLALCRTIINRQGGTVTAGNHPKGGAVFSIRFPK